MAKSANNHWAILGGTFDPVHIGHLRIAIQLREVGFTKVLLVPNHLPAHRPQPIAKAATRLAMLQLACQDLAGIEVNHIELERTEPSYSSVTIAKLKQQYPQSSFTWVLGQDAWQGFEHWHQPLSLLEQANLLVINRPGQTQTSAWQAQQLAERQASVAELLSSKQGKISFLHWPALDISASSLRKALAQGDNIRFLTPDSVLEYIQQHQLYR
ncbi:MAG: nicotinate-nucleotide adenylyltransferase [Venatoribacter sp.]